MPELMQPVCAAAEDCARRAMLWRVFELLDRERIAWCALHGHESWAERLPSDIDLLIDARVVPGKLAALLQQHRQWLGADAALWLDDGAQYIALIGRPQDSDATCVLQLHVSTDYALAGRTFYPGMQVLQSRRPCGGLWIPSPAIEFGCILVNRVVKQGLRAEHAHRLSELCTQNPAGCEREAARFLSPLSVRSVMQAAHEHGWDTVRRQLPELRNELFSARSAPSAGGGIGRWGRRVRRWIAPPCGLHVVFLGPDGVGKSTVIEAVRRDIAPAFLHDKYLTFAPALLPGRFETPKPNGPHSLPPRSFAASLIKAGWWAVCYTAGYYLTIHPALARAGLVINHRYLPDAIVDPKRYRYSGPGWILRALWRIAPKPHLLFLLDAPAEVIQARKKEVAPEETRRQRDAYSDVVGHLPFASIVDANRPVDEVVDSIERIITAFLAQRTARQRGLTPTTEAKAESGEGP